MQLRLNPMYDLKQIKTINQDICSETFLPSGQPFSEDYWESTVHRG